MSRSTVVPVLERKIREFRTSDLESIERLIAGLHPDWFTEEALENIPRDIRLARCLVFEKDARVTGFISVHSHDGKPMIGWLGVDRRERGSGIGRDLVTAVEEELRRFGYRDLRVETVGECTPPYVPYVETLRFYRSLGFTVEKRGRLRHDMGFAWRYSTLKKKLARGGSPDRRPHSRHECSAMSPFRTRGRSAFVG